MRRLMLAAALASFGCFGESEPIGGDAGGSSGGTCPPGFQGCACYGNQTCEAGLVCIVEADECIAQDCTPGEIGCSCVDQQCLGEAVCEQGVCEPPPGGSGDEATSASTGPAPTTGDATDPTTVGSTVDSTVGSSTTDDVTTTTSTGPCAGAADGDPCEGGTCHGGACCTGCWDGRACQPGTADEACGQAGDDCSVCSGGMCVPNAPCSSNLGLYPNVCDAGVCEQSSKLGCCPNNACDPKNGCQ